MKPKILWKTDFDGSTNFRIIEVDDEEAAGLILEKEYCRDIFNKISWVPAGDMWDVNKKDISTLLCLIYENKDKIFKK